MDISFSCADCGQKLVVDESGTGLVVPCPTCGHNLTIPAAPTLAGTTSRKPSATSAATSSAGPSKSNWQPKIPKAEKWMVALGGALLGIGLLGFFGYTFYGRLSQKDPPALLKQHVATMQETYAGLFHAKIVECTYDVQKTDSLVSPYIGYVNYTEDMGKGAMAKYKITLAFQDGAWVLQTVQRQFVWAGGSSSWKEILPSDDTASSAPFRVVKHALGL